MYQKLIAQNFTPYSGLFGNKSYFNTIKEALGYGMNYRT